MVYVVEKTTGKILDRADAWEPYAPELLQAELFTLHMHARPLDGTTITADILLPRIQVEAANAFYGKEV